jgi:serine protease Do
MKKMQKTNWILLMGLAALTLPALFGQPTPALAPVPPAPRVRMISNMHHSGGGYLGVGVEDVDSNRARALNLKEEHGAEVKHIEEGSPAAKAGLKESDVVLDYNGQRIEGVEQFIRMVGETPVGRRCTLNVWRNNANLTLTATVAARAGRMPGDDMFPAMPNMPNMPNMTRPMIKSMPPMPPMPEIPGFVWRASMLGIESEELNPQLAEYFGVHDGVLVRAVVKNSAAEKAGLKAGDVITKIDGTAVASPREISSMIRANRAKKSTSVTLSRSRKEMTLEVKRAEESRLQEEIDDLPL